MLHFSSISTGFTRQSRSEKNERLNFDKLGRLPDIENAYVAVSHAAPIVCMRTLNSTIVSFKSQNTSTLNWSLYQPLISLGGDSLFLLMTGHIGMPYKKHFFNFIFCKRR